MGSPIFKNSISIFCVFYTFQRSLSPKKWFSKNGLSVCMSVTTLQPKRKELRTSNLVHNLLVLMGRDSNIFEKIAHAQRVTCHRTFGVLTMLQKNGSNDFFQNRCIIGPLRVLKILQKLKDLYDLILVKVKKSNLI